jgi:predicted nuclease with TOPRIM domain
MPPPKELNPSDSAPQGEIVNATLHERMQELEIQNSQLQTLVVELLDKNEQLRRTLARLEETQP